MVRENEKWLLRIDPQRSLAVNARLQVRPLVEPWWREWSTDDDTLAANAGKTLYLAQLVDALRIPEREYTAGSIDLRTE